jgi:TetR/AcrR family transcriptional regulator, tetracycline repressor protein
VILGPHAKETLRRAGLDDLRLTDFAFEYSGRDYALLRPQRVALPHLTTFTLESILRSGDHDYAHVDLQQVWPDEVVLPPGDFDVVLLYRSARKCAPRHSVCCRSRRLSRHPSRRRSSPRPSVSHRCPGRTDLAPLYHPVMSSASRLPRGSLSTERIVAAALEIARTDGVDAVSIRRLAAHLGAARMSLYRHIPDKDTLLGMVANAVAENEIDIPDPRDGTWDQRLRELARSMRRQLQAYPGLVDLLATRGNTGVGGLRLVESILQILYGAGVTESQAARYYLVFIDIIVGRVHREVHGDVVAPARTGQLLAAAARRTDEFPLLARTRAHLEKLTPADIFEAELDLLVDTIGRAV